MKRLLAIYILVSTVFAQPQAETVIDSIKARFSIIQDYSVRLKLTAELPRIRMPRKIIDVYFKQPDLLKIEADGFAVVPKQGLGYMSVLDSLDGVTLIGDDDLNNFHCWLLAGKKVERDVTINTVVWVDKEDWVIRQINSSLDTIKIAAVEIEYDFIDDLYLLPVKTTVMIDMPISMESSRDHFDSEGPVIPHEDIPDLEKTSGKAVLEFSRYRVNRGLKDRIFKD